MTATSATSLATFADQFYKGRIAATRKTYGKGSVTYIGVVTHDYQLEKAVVRDVFEKAGIPTRDYPPGVIIDWAQGMWIGVNYSDKPYALTVGKTATFLIGGKEIPVAGVSVWIE